MVAYREMLSESVYRRQEAQWVIPHNLLPLFGRTARVLFDKILHEPGIVIGDLFQHEPQFVFRIWIDLFRSRRQLIISLDAIGV